MVVIMNEALELEPSLIVLEVGAGSGYHAATIAEQIGPQGHVYTIEQVTDLVDFARKNLERAGYSLLEQLGPQGVLLVPVGGRLFPQELVKAEKDPDGHVKKTSLGGVAFVPLIGKLGFEA